MVSNIDKPIMDALRGTPNASQFRAVSSLPDTSLGTVSGSGKDNQDRLAIVEYVAPTSSRSFRLYAVADGVGGLAKGSACAELAIAALVYSMVTSSVREFGVRLVDAFKHANERVYSTFQGDGATTLSVLAVSSGTRISLASVGDSRIYRYSVEGGSPKLEQLTEDDTIGNQVARAKGDKPSNISAVGLRGQLTQAIGADKSISPSLDVLSRSGSDRFLITSDGFHSVGYSNLQKLLAHSAWPSPAMERLVHLARWLGTKDDVSCIFVGHLPPVGDKLVAADSNSLTIISPHGTTVLFNIGSIQSDQVKADAEPDRKSRRGRKTGKRRTSKKAENNHKRVGSPPESHNSQPTRREAKGTDSTAEQSSTSRGKVSQQELEIDYVDKDQK